MLRDILDFVVKTAPVVAGVGFIASGAMLATIAHDRVRARRPARRVVHLVAPVPGDVPVRAAAR
jgi:hypothetical protein